MQFIFHGAGKEVGRSCIVLDNRFILDAGLKITTHGNEYPTPFSPETIEAVFISHAHLDHTGALPLLNHDGLRCPIFMTKMTKLTTEVLLEDSFHIEMMHHDHPGYAKKNILNVLQHIKNIAYNKPKRINNQTQVTFLDAGHIPGSASILLEYKNKRILYTGDINHQTTQLLKGARYNLKNIDVMITEATYGDRGHPNRQETEKDFIETIRETLENEGSVLIPAFAVGRAQELLLLLTSHQEITCPIYLDGMARKITDLYINNAQFIRDGKAIQNAQKRVQYITNKSQRKRLLRENCIILTTSGMVSGGPVMSYLKMMHENPDHAILLTGYQGEGTNGRLLLQQKHVLVDGEKLDWQGQIAQFDFSAHAGQQELIDAVKRIRPKDLIINHGDPIAVQALTKKVKHFVKRVHLPDVGQKVTIK
jgi:putative mRNA 3-end processing factor